jgi:lipoprotein-anchoring transpeptidase ErfK/SrfK
LLGVALSLITIGLCLLTLAAGVGLLLASDQVLPGVSAAGIDLGGMSQSEAAQALATAWETNGLWLRDEARTWPLSAAEAGLTLDAAATAALAHAWGRSAGGVSGLLQGLLGGATVAPVVQVDAARLSAYLEAVHEQVEEAPVNAGVRLVNGRVEGSPPRYGRALDVAATVARVQANPARELADGALDLVMVAVPPAIPDAAPLVAQASALLSGPFTLNGYDPIRDEWHRWTAPPEVWSAWLTAQPDPDSPLGLRLGINAESARAFVTVTARFSDERYVDADEAVTAMQEALAQASPSATVRVRHGETVYEVRGGQTLAAIAEEVGIPYPYIQAANPGLNTEALSVGQRLTIPSPDILVPLPPVPHKRIVVSRSQQHLWAYENGQVVFDWVISTGLPTSPTALGVFQVQTRDLNAYAQQWNLYMPYFMGFYHPGPGVDVWNGFHGFPTRGGGYLLWTGDLGRPVTYGCVLLSLENAAALYAWAEDGVIVEVRE